MRVNFKDLPVQEKWKILLKTILGSILVAVLFYRSLWAFIVIPILFVIFCKREEEEYSLRIRQELEEEFLSGIRILDTALQAGVSMENAWREVEKELGLLYGETSDFYLKVQKMNRSIGLNYRIETLFLDLAKETQLEDIMQFAQTLAYAKRSGGNWRKIIASTVHRLGEKQEAKKQIEVLVAEKKMEQQVMNIIPLGILGFLQLSSWDYMSIMYHNPLGVVCMSLLLIGYGGAIVLSERILKIQV